jgi:cell division septum initiation protein DivIVA
MSLLTLTAQQLRKAADLKDKIAALEKQLTEITGTQAAPVQAKTAKKRKMSAAGRAAVSAAQKARWSKINAAKGKPAVKPVVAKPAKKKFVMSAAAKAKISAAAKARWAKVKAAKK